MRRADTKAKVGSAELKNHVCSADLYGPRFSRGQGRFSGARIKAGSPGETNEARKQLIPGIHNYGDVFRGVSGFGVRDSQRRIWFRDFVLRTPNPACIRYRICEM